MVHRLMLLLADLAVLAIAAAIVLAVLPATPSPTSREGSPESTVVVRDMLGRTVSVQLPVERVVAAGPGALRILVYLNASSLVVGVEGIEKQWSPTGRPYIMAHLELRSLPVVGPGGPGKAPDPEAIAALDPDVVFVTFMPREYVDSLQEKLGIPVVSLGAPVVTSPNDLKHYYDALVLAGRILGREDRARELIRYIEAVLSDVRERVRGLNTSETVYVAGIGFKGQRGVTSTWCMFPPLALLGVKSVVDKLGCKPGHVEIDRELLLLFNPDIIFIDGNGLGVVMGDYAANREYYSALKAFREGRVYVLLPYNYYATNLELALVDTYFIGKVLFPERFNDIDISRKANEIIKFFVGKALYDELSAAYSAFKAVGLEDLEVLLGGG